MHTSFKSYPLGAETGRRRISSVLFPALLLSLAVLPRPCPAAPAGSTGVAGGRFNAPLYFEANRGQVDNSFPFVARGIDCDVLIAPTEAVLVLGQAKDPALRSWPERPGLDPAAAFETRSVRFRLEGARPEAAVAGLAQLPGKVNYYIGNNRSAWRSGIPLFPRVQIDQVYPGIRLIYHADASARLEYDFIVQPGARPDQIGLRIDGVDALRLDDHGALVLKIGGGEVRQHEPVLYQIVRGQRKQVAGGYRLKGPAAAGFWVGTYDRNLPLVIDPTLSVSEFIGGKKHDKAWGVAADGNGNVWMAGETLSKDLATTAGALRPDYRGGHNAFGDGFVARFDQGTNLAYLTYLGGKGQDAAFGIALGTNGEAFVTGYTDAMDFPITNAFQSHLAGTNLNARRVFLLDAFVTKLNPDGTLAYSTYLGGKDRDVGLGIAVDTLNRAYVSGFTESRDLPVSNPVQGPYLRDGSNYDGSVYHGKGDAFVARLSPDGTALEYCTYLGGTNHDQGESIAVDAAFRAHVVGVTASTNFPVTNAFAPLAFYLNQQPKNSFNSDGFISTLSSNGDRLVYSAYVGGTQNDAGLAVTVDGPGNAYLTGYTFSTNFPVTAQDFTAWPSRTNSNCDVFVMRLDPAGSTNGGYAVVFGGKSNDQGTGIATDAAQNACVVGTTASRTNFANLLNSDVLPPGFSATNSTLRKFGTEDAFVVQLDPAGRNLFAGYFGGTANDEASGVAFDTNANAAYVVGITTSTNFPGTAPATYHGKRSHSDAVISRIQFP